MSDCNSFPSTRKLERAPRDRSLCRAPSSNFECHEEKSQKVRLGVCEVTTLGAEVVIGIEIGPRGARFVSEKSREIQSLEGTRGREGPEFESRICVACHPRPSFVSVPRDTIAIFHIGTR